jgi:adenylate kinase family enzyme
VLGPDDPLPRAPRRVLVAGTSGAGKTTLALQVARVLGVGHVEIDALFHGPGWVARPTFEADVEAFTAGPAWVTEWQYPAVRELLADRADLLVWLDLPRRTVLRQVVVRTLRRRLGRQVLWNGNLEPPLWTFLTDPEHIVRWAWSTYDLVAVRVSELAEQRPDLPVVRLRSRADTQRWLAGPLAHAAQEVDP